MTREEHLQWCKDRAIEYADKGDTVGAFTSFQSDMSKHEETKKHMALEMMTMMYLGGHLAMPAAMRKFIEDFN